MKLSLPMQRALLRMEPGREYLFASDIPAAWHTVEALVRLGLVRWVEYLRPKLTPAGAVWHGKLKSTWGDSEP